MVQRRHRPEGLPPSDWQALRVIPRALENPGGEAPERPEREEFGVRVSLPSVRGSVDGHVHGHLAGWA